MPWIAACSWGQPSGVPSPSLNRLVELAVAIATTNSKGLLCRQMRAKLVRVALLDSSRVAGE